MSDHTIEVVRIGEILPHPDADTLGIVKVHGYTCIVRLGDWQPDDLAAYVIPDSIVDTTREPFAFLEGHPRIKVKRLRGVYSQGLLVRAPEGLSEGDDAAEALGVTHYEPPEPALRMGGEAESPPPGFRPTYDVENYYRYPDLFLPDEEVVVTEKIHGANARFAYIEGRFWCGSKKEWKKEDTLPGGGHEGNLWWRALRQYPGLQALLKNSPYLTAYGEVYGAVQDLKYGTKPGEIRLALFDLWRTDENRYLDFDSAHGVARMYGVSWAPFLWRGTFDAALVQGLADGDSKVPGAGHVREGVVVRSAVERMDARHGRVQLKVVSNRYLERA